MATPKLNAEELVNRFDEQDGSDYGDGPNDVTDDNDEGEEETGEESDDSGETGSANANASDTDDDGEDTNTGTANQRNDKQQDELRPAGTNHLQDSRGNLYDRNGKYVARAGSERRLYERNVRMQYDIDQLRQQNTDLTRQLSSHSQNSDVSRQYGLDANDMKVGLPIIGEFKRDPVKAARNVLEMVMGMGHNLSEILGQNAKDAVEMGAISRLLDERLAPLQQLTQSAERQKREQETNRAAEIELQRFFSAHENSSVHADAIDALMGRREGLTPESAYYELRLFAQQHGLDFTRPLAPQIQQANAQRPNRQQTRRTSVPPMPNGNTGRRQMPMPEAVEVEANATWDTIIRNSLRTNRS